MNNAVAAPALMRLIAPLMTITRPSSAIIATIISGMLVASGRNTGLLVTAQATTAVTASPADIQA
jgi:hypothetical protein